MPVVLDADAAFVYKAFQEAGRPAYETLSPDEARGFYLAARIVTNPEPPELQQVSAEPPAAVSTDDGLWFSAPEGLLTLWQAEKRVAEEVERRMISEALVLNRGDKVAAAQALGIHAKTFARKMREYELMGFVGW